MCLNLSFFVMNRFHENSWRVKRKSQDQVDEQAEYTDEFLRRSRPGVLERHGHLLV